MIKEWKKLKQIVELIPKGLANPDKVIEGFINASKVENGTLGEEETLEVLKRRLICETCPLNSVNAKTSSEYKALFGENYKTEIDTPHCSICSCMLGMKTASLSSECGLSYYNSLHPENPQKLKWLKYKDESDK